MSDEKKGEAPAEAPKAPQPKAVWRCPNCGRPHLFRTTCAWCGKEQNVKERRVA